MTKYAGNRPASNLSFLKAHIETSEKLSFSAWSDGVGSKNGGCTTRKNFKRRLEKLSFQQGISVQK